MIAVAVVARFSRLVAIVAAIPLARAATPPVWERPPGWTGTHGGERGAVLTVETFAPEGPGSLGAALSAKGARTIVFKVGGVIDLASHSYRIREPFVTIAGETAPSPGITLIRGGIRIATHDVILRHVRVRTGAEGHAKKSGWEVDACSTDGDAHDVIVDHSSFAWATDENLSASGPRFHGKRADEWREGTSHRITFSHCLVGEALRDSAHGKGPHSMGSLIHDNATDILIYGNLYISNAGRNPLFKGGARGAVINNFVHNPGGAAFSYGLVPEEWGSHDYQDGVVSLVGNVILRGRDTGGPPALGLIVGPGACYVHAADNIVRDPDSRDQPPVFRFRESWDKPTTDTDTLHALRPLKQPPFDPPGLRVRPSGEVIDWVLSNVGARPWDRDTVDRRLVEEARTGRGKIIDSEAEVGGNGILQSSP